MNENILFWKIFAKRTALCYFLIITLFLICILRIAVISSNDYSAVTLNQNYYKLKIANLRGTVFDKNMIPLTNNTKKIIACVSPTPRAITGISAVLKNQELKNVLERLKDGKPVLCEVPEKINCDGIVCIGVYDSVDTVALHTVGLVDSSGDGIMGIEKAYNELLKGEEAEILYECDGKGNILEGASPSLQNDTSIVAKGVVSTIDINLQTIAENSAKAISKGAIVVADVKTGKIRACVSMPNFDKQNMGEALSNEDSPFLNRAVNTYNVGSVFKPCVAAAGIEANKDSFLYNCSGSCEIIDRVFKCHKLEGHGYLELKGAIAQSCNTFFYNFSFNVGAENILKTANNLKFGKGLKLCENIQTASGNLPSLDTLKNIAQLANFSIGQGELLLSPISMLTLYCAIANNGIYYTPTIVEGTVKDGKFHEYGIGNPTRAFSKETAEKLKDFLKEVLLEGTGTDALPKTVTAAGKTATAQTGKFLNGTEICQGWFCGFFPEKDPQFAVIIFSENTLLQTKTCSQIFAEIADNITEIMS